MKGFSLNRGTHDFAEANRVGRPTTLTLFLSEGGKATQLSIQTLLEGEDKGIRLRLEGMTLSLTKEVNVTTLAGAINALNMFARKVERALKMPLNSIRFQASSSLPVRKNRHR